MKQDEFLSWLYEFCEGNQVETRALLKGKAKSAFHDLGDWKSIDQFCRKYSSWNLYFGVGTRNGGGRREHVAEVSACWADLDFKNVPEKQLKKAVYEFPMRPSRMIHSGGGFQPYWRFREPLTQEDLDRLEAVNKQIALYFKCDDVSDAPRILRLPGTTNHKYDEKPEARVIWQNDIDYTLEDFEDFFADLAASPSASSYEHPNNKRINTYKEGKTSDRDKAGQSGTQRDNEFEVDFSEGNHDNSLFSVALHLGKGGMSPDNVLETIEFLAHKLDPDNETKQWARAKVKSAFDRLHRRERSLAEEIRDFVRDTSGTFSGTECDINLNIGTKRDKENRRKILCRLEAEGVIERCGTKGGVYRTVDATCEEIDFLGATDTELRIKWPLDIQDHFKMLPRNIAVIAGDQDAGKTAFLLNFCKLNMFDHEIHYFSSEMGSEELRSRLDLFPDLGLEDWKRINAKERSGNFSDVIRPDAINIIDYMEIHENFFLIAQKLQLIYEKLNKGGALVALQKSPNVELGRGGSFSLEKPRLYLSISNSYPGHTIKIVKAKNWRTTDNPNRLQRHFKVYNGCQIIETTDWRKEDG